MTETPKEFDFKKAIRKTRVKFISLILLISFVCVMLVTYIIPSFFQAAIQMRTDEYTRMLSNLVQSETPVSNVGFYNNVGGFYNIKVGTIASEYTGFKIASNAFASQVMIERKVSIPFMDLEYTQNYGSNFNVNQSDANTEVLKQLLVNNPNNTAIVDLSLRDTIQIDQVKDLLKNYDVEAIWLAVLTGLENEHPNTMSMGEGAQYHQFGFPTRTYIESLTPRKIDFDNPTEYIEFIKNEWKWCLKNRNLVKKDKDLIIFNEMEAALESDLKIYGIRVVGPTDELLKLCDHEAIASGTVSKFYAWDWVR